MKMIKTLSILAMTLMAFTATSCLSDDDSNGGSFQVNGADFVTVDGFTTDNVNFSVVTAAGKISSDKYPVGSRAYITYNMMSNQDIDLPVKVNLTAALKAETITPQSGTDTDCKLDYPSFTVSNRGKSGNYINLLVQVREAGSRTWRCFINESESTGEIVNLYLDTQAQNEKTSSVSQALCINVGPFVNNSQYKEIHLHLNNQSQQNNVYKFPAPYDNNYGK